MSLRLGVLDAIEHLLQGVDATRWFQAIKVPTGFVNDESHGSSRPAHPCERRNIYLILIKEPRWPRRDVTPVCKE